MTEKQMNTLADIIIAKIKLLQDELDANFFEKADDMSETMDLAYGKTDSVSEKVIKETDKVLLAQLEMNLGEAINKENYKLADIIHKKIKDLKNK